MGACQSAARPCFAVDDATQTLENVDPKQDTPDSPLRQGSIHTLEVVEPELDALSCLAAASLSAVPWKDQEANAWLNSAIARLWPMLVQVIITEVKDVVNTAIKDNLPDWIEGSISIDRFALGMDPPEICRIECTETAKGLKVQVGFDMDSGVDIAMSVGLIKIGISQLKASGDVTLLLEPLIGEKPLVGAIKIFCADPPNLDYSFSGLAVVANLPLVKNAIRLAIDKAIAGLVVLPHFQTVQLVEFDKQDFSDGSREPIGVLRVHAVSAKGLAGSDWHLFSKSTSDPFLQVQVGDQIWKTTTVKGTCDPKWPETETYDFAVYDQTQVISITVMDEDCLNSDDRLGQPEPVQIVDALKLSGKKLPLFEKATFIRRGAVYTEGPGKGELFMTFSWLDSRPGDKGRSRSVQGEGHLLKADIRKLTLPARFSKSVQVRLHVPGRGAESQYVSAPKHRVRAAVDGVDKAILKVIKNGGQLGLSAKTLSMQTGLKEAIVAHILNEGETERAKEAIADRFVAAQVKVNACLAIPLAVSHVQSGAEATVEIRDISGTVVAHGNVKLNDMPLNAESNVSTLLQLEAAADSGVDGAFALEVRFSMNELQAGASSKA